MPTLSQAETLRRGLALAAMIWQEPLQVETLAQRLDMEGRAVERLLAGLREAGLTISVEARGRERYHRLVTMPLWLAHAIETLAAPAVRDAEAAHPEIGRTRGKRRA